MAATDRAPPQPRRVEVAVAAPNPQVEPIGAEPDDLTSVDAVADRHRDAGQADVRRPNPVGVVHRHHQPTGDGSGEGHRTRADRPHRGADRGGVLDAPVAGEPWLRWWTERVQHRRVGGRSVHRWTGCCAGRCAGGGPAGHCERDGERDRERRSSEHDEGPASRLAEPSSGRWGYAGSRWAAWRRLRSWSTDLVWIWLTRLSVTPRTSPIWARVRFSK